MCASLRSKYKIISASAADPATLRYILAHGCPANLGETLVVAAQHGNVRTVRFLHSRFHLEAPTLIRIVDPDQATLASAQYLHRQGVTLFYARPLDTLNRRAFDRLLKRHPLHPV